MSHPVIRWSERGIAWWNSKTDQERRLVLESVAAKLNCDPTPAQAYAMFVEPKPNVSGGAA